MSYITTQDNTKLYVKDWGEGRPVILIHGWPLSADSWDDQMIAIANAGFRAIAYDRRGFGRSDQPWSGYEYDTLADDLAAVIAATGAQRRHTRRLFDGWRRGRTLYVTPRRQAGQPGSADLVDRPVYAPNSRQSERSTPGRSSTRWPKA